MNQDLSLLERLEKLEKASLEQQNTLTTLFVALLVTVFAAILSVGISVKLFVHAGQLQSQVNELRAQVTAIVADRENVGG